MGFLPDGKMITPTIPSVEKMSLHDISAYISNITRRIENTNVNEMFYKAVNFNSIVPFLKRLDEIFAKPNIIHKW
ncbi:hypothetical protein [Clostridium psychrophilum]|uniref:hypothetical protein n=1 Tax=Clostridium psychrophilum TaxID=132926 RepID=UPI001C0CD0D3|nr:hypothetical protein [Clostridium psychrophilum]MBU3182634.1 hypothetical protein [Clostridium psychrophilum]